MIVKKITSRKLVVIVNKYIVTAVDVVESEEPLKIQQMKYNSLKDAKGVWKSSVVAGKKASKGGHGEF